MWCYKFLDNGYPTKYHPMQWIPYATSWQLGNDYDYGPRVCPFFTYKSLSVWSLLPGWTDQSPPTWPWANICDYVQPSKFLLPSINCVVPTLFSTHATFNSGPALHPTHALQTYLEQQLDRAPWQCEVHTNDCQCSKTSGSSTRICGSCFGIWGLLKS